MLRQLIVAAARKRPSTSRAHIAHVARPLEVLEQRLLLHAGHVHEQELPLWHADEHALADASAWMPVPPSPAATPTMLTAGVSPDVVAADSSTSGAWGSVLQWPSDAIHAAMLPSGSVLFWNNKGATSLWNPATNVITNVADPSFNSFCSGHAFLADGRLLVMGGHIANGVGLPNAAVFDPATNSWTNLPNMNAGRWYPNATTLGNGDVSVSGGTDTDYDDPNLLPQVWQADGSGWRNLTTALRDHPYYPHTYLTASGNVYYAGPGQLTFSLNPTGTGSWTDGPTRVGGSRSYGSGVMYDNGKVFIAGGSDPPKATAEVINLNSANPQWRAVDSMSSARRHMNATVLADGQVLVTGGVSGAGFNNRSTPVYSAELWDPVTEQFTTMASMTQPRWYHSVALLLPDGRVLSAGGDDNPTGEVFSPPYLFKGARPTITAAPDAVTWGQTFDVATPDGAGIANVNLIRMGSATHAFNYDQRMNKLSFTQTAGGLRVTAPAQPNLAPPGYYMMFILDGNGVPSVSKIVRLGVADGASSQAPFGGTPGAVPGTIEAENYDVGGSFVAWHDTTSGNAGDSQHRSGDDVDIYALADAGAGKAVGDLAANEWLEYTVNVATGGLYTLTARLAAGAGQGGAFQVEVDGVNRTGARTLAATDGQWQDVASSIVLTAGVHVMRVHINAAGPAGFGRFDRFALAVAPDQPPTVAVASSATPGLVGPGAAATLSVVGADDGGESNLTYAWSIVSKPSGAADPTFSATGTNAAKQVSATFAAVGTYNLRATITDAAGQTATSDTSVTVAQTVQTTLRSDADAYARGGSYASQNFGQDHALIVKKSSDASSTRESYVRFDFASLSANAIGKAVLRFNGHTSSSQTVPITVHGATGAVWTEAGLNWNNKPPADAAVLGTATVLGGTDKWYEFDVTAFLRAQQQAGATSVTFVVKATSNTDASIIFKSDEYPGNKPFLVIDHGPAAPPPPPVLHELIVTPTQLGVNEGSSGTFSVRLASQPAEDVNVAISKVAGGDADLTTSLDVPLTFTPDNWNVPQQVQMDAAQDADVTSGAATFNVSASGALTRSVSVSEIDDDAPPVPIIETLTLRAAADAYVRGGSSAGTNFGNDVQLIVKRTSGTASTRETYLRFDLSNVGATIESAVLRLHGRLLSSGAGVNVQVFSVSNVTWSETGLTWNNKPASGSSVLASKTVSSTTKQWYELDLTSHLQQLKAAGATAVTLVLKAGNVTEPQAAFDSDETNPNRPELVVRHSPQQGLIVSATSVSVPEGSSRTFTVRLAKQPVGDVSVSVTRQSGDADLTGTPSGLTFTTTNWDQPQTVTIAAGEDGDTVNGSATFAVSSSGLDTKSVTASEIDNDVPLPPPGPVTLRAAADAYVRDGSSANTNFGSATELQLKKNGTGSNREIYLKFDLANVADITSAKLRLYGRIDSASERPSVAVYGAADTSWSESGLTWNNRPAASGAALATVTVATSTRKYYEWDVSSFLQAELAAGRTTVTLVLRSLTTTTPHMIFSSDEASANRPELVLTP